MHRVLAGSNRFVKRNLSHKKGEGKAGSLRLNLALSSVLALSLNVAVQAGNTTTRDSQKSDSENTEVSPDTSTQNADALFSRGKYAEAAKIYLALSKQVTGREELLAIYHGIAQCQFKVGKAKDAKEAIDEAIKLLAQRSPEESRNQKDGVSAKVIKYGLEKAAVSVPECDTVVAHLRRTNPSIEIELLGDISLWYTLRNDKSRALQAALTQAQIYESYISKKGKRLSEIWSSVSDLYRLSGKVEPSMMASEKAWHALSKADRHSELGANTVASLGFGYFDFGRIDAAIAMYRIAIAGDGKYVKKDTDNRASILNNLAKAYALKGRFEESEKIYKHAIAMQARLAGSDSSLTTWIEDNLAMMYLLSGRSFAAEPLVEHSLRCRSKDPGENSVDYAISLNTKAMLELKKKNLDDAENFARRAINLRIKLQGRNHPDLVQSLNTLAEVLLTKGRYYEPRARLFSAKQICSEHLFKSHPEYLRTASNLAKLPKELDVYKKYEGRIVPNEPPFQLLSDGEEAYKRGDYELAIALFQTCLANYERQQPIDFYIGACINWLGGALRQTGDLEASERICRIWLEKIPTHGSKNLRDRALIGMELISILQEKVDPDSAQRIADALIAENDKLLGPYNTSSCELAIGLADMYLDLAKPEKSIPYYTRVLNQYCKQYYSNEDSVKDLEKKLADASFSSGNYEAAAGYFRKVYEKESDDDKKIDALNRFTECVVKGNLKEWKPALAGSWKDLCSYKTPEGVIKYEALSLATRYYCDAVEDGYSEEHMAVHTAKEAIKAYLESPSLDEFEDRKTRRWLAGLFVRACFLGSIDSLYLAKEDKATMIDALCWMESALPETKTDERTSLLFSIAVAKALLGNSAAALAICSELEKQWSTGESKPSPWGRINVDRLELLLSKEKIDKLELSLSDKKREENVAYIEKKKLYLQHLSQYYGDDSLITLNSQFELAESLAESGDYGNAEKYYLQIASTIESKYSKLFDSNGDLKLTNTEDQKLLDLIPAKLPGASISSAIKEEKFEGRIRAIFGLMRANHALGNKSKSATYLNALRQNELDASKNLDLSWSLEQLCHCDLWRVYKKGDVFLNHAKLTPEPLVVAKMHLKLSMLAESFESTAKHYEEAIKILERQSSSPSLKIQIIAGLAKAITAFDDNSTLQNAQPLLSILDFGLQLPSNSGDQENRRAIGRAIEKLLVQGDRYEDAARVFERVESGATAADIADRLLWEAELIVQQRPKLAKALMERATQLATRDSTESSDDAIERLIRNSEVYTSHRIDQPDAAEPQLLLALKLLEKKYGLYDKALIPTLYKLGYFYDVEKPKSCIDPNKRAVEFYQRVFDILAANKDTSSFDVADAAFNLAEILKNTGQRGEALKYYERAAHVWDVCLPEGSKHRCLTVERPAEICLFLGNLDKAKTLYERAIQMRKVACSRADSNEEPGIRSVVVTNMGQLSKVLEKLGDSEGAEKLAREAMYLAGYDNQFVWDVVSQQCYLPLLLRQKKYDKVAEYFQMILDDDGKPKSRTMMLNRSIRRMERKHPTVTTVSQQAEWHQCLANRRLCSSILRKLAKEANTEEKPLLADVADLIEQSHSFSLSEDALLIGKMKQIASHGTSVELARRVLDSYIFSEWDPSKSREMMPQLVEDVKRLCGEQSDEALMMNLLWNFSVRHEFSDLPAAIRRYAYVADTARTKYGDTSVLYAHCLAQFNCELNKTVGNVADRSFYDDSLEKLIALANDSWKPAQNEGIGCSVNTLIAYDLLALSCFASRKNSYIAGSDRRIANTLVLLGQQAGAMGANLELDIADFASALGDFLLAREALDAAASMSHETDDAYLLSRALLLSAEIAMIRDDAIEAATLADSVCANSRNMNALDDNLKLRALKVLLAANVRLGHLQLATKHGESALALLKKNAALPEQKADMLITLAGLELANGNEARADKCVKEAMTLLKLELSHYSDRLTCNTPEAGAPLVKQLQAVTLKEEADILLSRGDILSASSLYETASGIYKGDSSVASVLNFIDTQTSLAEIDWRNKDFSSASARVLESAAKLDKIARESFPYLSFAEKCAFIDVFDKQLETLFTYCHRDEQIQQVYRFAIFWDGLLVESLRQQSALGTTANDPAAKELLDKLKNLRARLEISSRSEAGDLKQQVRVLNQEKEYLERQVTAILKTKPIKDPAESIDSKAFLKVLRADEAYLSVVTFTSKQSNKRAYGVVVCSASGGYSFVDLGNSEEVDKVVASWLRCVSAGAAGNGVVPGKEQQKRDSAVEDEQANAPREKVDLKLLAEAVWTPIVRKLPEGAKRLYINPSGSLEQLPWGSIVGSKDDGCAVTLLGSPRELITLKQGTVQTTKADDYASPVLVVGDVAFGDAPLLPATRKEASEVCSLVKDTGHDYKLLTQSDADKKRVCEELEKCSYAHLATHGYFVSGDNHQPQVSGNRRQRLFRVSDNVVLVGGRNPLLLSGLVLAAQSGQTTSDRLTAEEIVSLDLSKCKLIALSACETGLGRHVANQGAMGLRAALHSAGAKTILMSMWKVDDDATCYLMQRFYHYLWNQKMCPSLALASAQKDVREQPKWRAPFYWAAWQIAGRGW